MSEEVRDAIAHVKRFTSVPEDFVDDLFRLYTPATSQTDPVIPLDDIAKWLNAPKKGLRATLYRTYIKGIDYVSRKVPNPLNIVGRRGSNNYSLVLTSPDCFKRLCMLSRTKNAEMVRSYFIDVETQFLKYREELMEGLRRDLNPRRALQPPACNSSGAGYIYIIRATDDGLVRLFKVGRTCDLKARLFSYQTGKAHEVELLYVLKVSDMKSAEKCVRDHVREFQFRTRREVYQVPIDMLKDIMGKCNALDGVKKEYARRQATRGGSATPQFYAAFSRDLVQPFLAGAQAMHRGKTL